MGCKIMIDTPDGQRTAVISPGGEVWLILGDHQSGDHHDAWVTQIQFCKASKEEAKEFLDIYRRCIPDSLGP
jgi:hypothetical protein